MVMYADLLAEEEALVAAELETESESLLERLQSKRKIYTKPEPSIFERVTVMDDESQ